MSLELSNDLIHRFLFQDSDIRGEIVTLDRSFQEASTAQVISYDLLPLYGEFLAGAAMISEMLKFDGTVTLQARGDGPVPIIMAEATSNGNIRGVITTELDSGQIVNPDTKALLPLSELVGNGVLTLTLDPAKGKRYQGIVPMESKDLAACLGKYFEQSEQVPTHIKLFANSDKCGGVFLQGLPAQQVMDEEQRQEQWSTAIQFLATCKQEEFFSLSHPSILHRLFHEMNCVVFEPKSLQFKCSCSRERSVRALASLGTEELKQVKAENKDVTIDCQFCGSQYRFGDEDIQALIDKANTLH